MMTKIILGNNNYADGIKTIFLFQARENVFVNDFEGPVKQKLDKLEQDLRRKVNELKTSKTPTNEEFQSALNDIQNTTDFLHCQNEFDVVKLQRLKT